jgi:hypothetical protein
MVQKRQFVPPIPIQVVYVSPDGTKENGPLLRFPLVELNPREEGALRERLKTARERMKGYRPQPSETENRVEYHRASALAKKHPLLLL